MVYSHCTGTGPGMGQGLGTGLMGSNILCRNPEETSPEDQNRVISGPTKRTHVLQNFFFLKKKNLMQKYSHWSKTEAGARTHCILLCQSHSLYDP